MPDGHPAGRNLGDLGCRTGFRPLTPPSRPSRRGEIVVVMDAEDRENEGDFICAAEKVTPDSRQFHDYPRPRTALHAALARGLSAARSAPHGGREHGAAGDQFHRAGGPSQLPHGDHGPGAGDDDPGDRRSGEQAGRFRPPGPPVSLGGQGGRGASPGRPYGGGGRSGPAGRVVARRRALRNSRRQRRPRPPASSSMPWPSSTACKSSPSRS